MTERWKPMRTAPKDGTIIEVRHRSKAEGELVFKTRWLASRKVWLDWDRMEVALTKIHLKGWRLAEDQDVPWTPEELAILTELHGPPAVTYLDVTAHQLGIRKPVEKPRSHFL